MNKDEFILELKKLGIVLSINQINNLEIYKSLLQEYNKKFNLTTIIEDNDIYLKHFYDCLYLITLNEVKSASNILDIGSGAGFPGMVLGIILNDINVFLVESNGKKCSFLNKVINSLKLDNVTVINSRAEDYVKQNREKSDIVTSRAVSDMIVLSELSLPAVKVNGYFIPMKSHIDEELKYSSIKIKDLGGMIEDIIKYELPNEKSVRSVVKIKKINNTDKIYPRDYSKIIKDLKKVQK